LSLITPPNCGAGAGSSLPLIVVVALGDPGVPVVCICAFAEGAIAINDTASMPLRRICLADFMGINTVGCCFSDSDKDAKLRDFAGVVYRTLGQWPSPR
jgi:hypothetical protein